jgi:hypothetical protein
MRNLIALTLTIVAGLMIGITSCQKDKLDEEERLLLLDSLQNKSIVHYSVSVFSAADAGIMKAGNNVDGLSGANVAVNIAGNIVSSVTNEDGLATFSNLRGGNVLVTIKIEGYTDVSFISDITPEDQNQYYSYASTMVPLFPISGEWMTEIGGIATYQSDLTNMVREKAAGVKVIAAMDINANFMNTFFPDNTGQGKVSSIAYSSVLMTTTTNENGEYSLMVPAAAQGLDIVLDVAEFETDQKIVLSMLNGEEVTGVQSVRTIFGNQSISTTSIPDVSGAYITIGAPTGAVGIYSQQATIGNPVIIDGSITAISVINPGSGYTSTPNVIITGNGSGAQANAVLGSGGSIESINITNGGSNYTNASASLYIASYRENAKAIPNINSSGIITGVNITNSGKGYITAPGVSVSSQISAGSGAAVVIYSSNISNGSINSITVTNGGSNYQQSANFPASSENANIPATGLSLKVYSGKPLIKDLNLGTGRRTITN